MRRGSGLLSVASVLWVFGVIAIFSLLIIGWSVYNIYIADQVTIDMQREARELMEIEEIEITLLEQEIAEKDYLLSSDPKYMDVHHEYEIETEHFIEMALHDAAGAEERAGLENLQRLKDEYEENFTALAAEADAGNRDEAIRLSLEVSDEKLALVHTQVQDLIFSGEAMVMSETAEAESHVRQAILVGVAGLVFLPVLAVWAFVTASQLTLPFLTLINAAHATAGYRYHPDMLETLIHRRDGLGRVARAMDRTATTLMEREAALRAEVEALERELLEVKRKRLVTVLPGQRRIAVRDQEIGAGG